MSPAALAFAERTRRFAVVSTAEEVRADYSQYLTPYQTAMLAASLFSDAPARTFLRCLDLGAGTGILSVALANRYHGHLSIDAVELDRHLAQVCDNELTKDGIPHTMILGDALQMRLDGKYDRIILNPPYKKMAADDPRQASLPVRSPNLYAAFMMVAATALAPGGECVAIVPRSWMNGAYFQQFRQWLLAETSLDALHVYGSRTEIFSDTNVLQETMIVSFSKRPQASTVRVSESQVKSEVPVIRTYPFDSLVDRTDGMPIRVEPVCSAALNRLGTLKEVGLCASTGKVVDFRSRDVIYPEYHDGLDRLIYSCNFSDQGFRHPVSAGKPQWIDCSSEKFSRQLTPTGSYVVVKRFSSKEERRRVKAYPLDLESPAALENHLNCIHAGTPRNTVPLGANEARGLALWLSSSDVEEWFRARSGSTQVNASDLNSMPTPTRKTLARMGEDWAECMPQEEIDVLCQTALT